MDTSQNAKEFWGKEVTTANLVWPNESIIKFVKKICLTGIIRF